MRRPLSHSHKPVDWGGEPAGPFTYMVSARVNGEFRGVNVITKGARPLAQINDYSPCYLTDSQKVHLAKLMAQAPSLLVTGSHLADVSSRFLKGETTKTELREAIRAFRREVKEVKYEPSPPMNPLRRERAS